MGGAGFLLIVIAFAALYFVLVRPAKRRQLEQRKLLNEVHAGDEVLTAGGIYGEVVDVKDDEISLRIAPGLDVRVARRAIAGVTPAETVAGELEPADEPDVSGPTPGT
jgi:preprotein translocase subunit YajC